MDATEKRARAEAARQLLESDAFREALGAVETAAVDGLAAAALSDASALQRHAALLQAVRAIREQVVQTARTMGERPSPAVA